MNGKEMINKEKVREFVARWNNLHWITKIVVIPMLVVLVPILIIMKIVLSGVRLCCKPKQK